MREYSSERSGVRSYKKSEYPRLRWTPPLHQHFVEAVQSLGGKYEATPKRILQTMCVKGLKISHVKSHLQMYRSMKPVDKCNDFINDSRKHLHEVHFEDLRSVFSIFSPQRINIQGRELMSVKSDFDHQTTSDQDTISLWQKEEEISCENQDRWSLTSTLTSLFKSSHAKEEITDELNESRGLSLSRNAQEYCGLCPNSTHNHDLSISPSTSTHNYTFPYSLPTNNHINLDLTI